MEYLEIGQIVNTQGLNGEVKIYPFTNDITRFNNLKKIYISVNNEKIKVKLEKVRFLKNMVIAKFVNLDKIEEVEKYKGKYIFIDEEDKLNLPSDTYYIADLIGLNVIDNVSKKSIGNISEVFSTKANDIYVVKTVEGKEIFLPAIKEVILDINITLKNMYVNLIEGLI